MKTGRPCRLSAANWGSRRFPVENHNSARRRPQNIQKIRNESALRKAGYNVLSAADGEQALQLAREKLPDLILLDMLLAKLGGPELLTALKRATSPQRQFPLSCSAAFRK
jgi:CheY-like chemotaxis protein